jgi:hypothetical protein
VFTTPFSHDVMARKPHSPRGIGPETGAIRPYGRRKQPNCLFEGAARGNGDSDEESGVAALRYLQELEADQKSSRRPALCLDYQTPSTPTTFVSPNGGNQPRGLG